MKNTTLSMAIAAVLAAGAVPLHAAAPTAADTLEEVVVTAQRRSERLQDVPVSVTAFSETQIRDAGIKDTADFIGLTPNVTFDTSFTVGNSFVTARGVQQINNADPPVAIVVDGVAQGNQKQLKMDLFDVERIEVLKGPQGALYGRNAIGGAINIITKQPTDHLTGFLEAGTGSGSLKDVVGALSGAIVKDKLLFRVSGEYKDSDGQITNYFLNKKVDFYTGRDIRGKLLWLPTDDLSFDFRVAHIGNDGGSTYDIPIPTTFTDPTNVQDLQPRANILGHSKLKSDEMTLKVDYKVGGGTLNYIAGWTKLRENYYGSLGFCNPVDCPGGFFGFGTVDQAQDLRIRMVSHEVRYTSSADQKLRYIVGAYYLDTSRDLSTVATLVDLGFFPIVNNNEHNINKAYAGFGQLDWDFIDKTTLSLSLRHDQDERHQTDQATGNQRARSFSSWQPKATLTRKFSDRQLGYITYSTGFRSGGFNGVGQLDPFKQENLRNIEAGYKSSWMDNRLIVNVAAFLEKDRDFQWFYVDLNAGGAQVISNIPRVEMKGLELETQMLFTPGWTGFLNVGILKSEIKEVNAAIAGVAAVGNKPPKTVPSKVNIGTQYEWNVSSALAKVRVDFERRGKKYWHTDNVDVMNPVSLLSARASLTFGDWEVAVEGKNLLNKYYFEDFNATKFTGLPNAIGWPTQPRNWGASVHYSFK
jgi:iron complex outermembrane receptor protein